MAHDNDNNLGSNKVGQQEGVCLPQEKSAIKEGKTEPLSRVVTDGRRVKNVW